METFHGCMTKNKDGTNRIIEKNYIIHQLAFHFGKKLLT